MFYGNKKTEKHPNVLSVITISLTQLYI